MTKARHTTSDRSVAQRLDQPVVLVGAVRSGTTMLHLMLGGHPRLRMLGEFEESVKWLPDEGWISPADFRDRLAIDRVFRSRGAPVPAASTYPAAVHELASHYFADLDEHHVPGFVVHSRIDRVADLWPSLRVIHIVRDPRDVARSCIGMGWAGHVWPASSTWLTAEERFDRLVARVGEDRVTNVRYEDLVRRPREELTRVLQSIGLDWVDDIFAHIDASTYDRPDPRFIEQWRRKLSPREIELVEARCGHLMESRGYERAAGDARPPRRLERMMIATRHRWNRWSFSRRRYGLRLALLRPVASRLGPTSKLRETVQLRVNEISRRHLK